MVDNMNGDLSSVNEWAVENGLLLNPEKNKVNSCFLEWAGAWCVIMSTFWWTDFKLGRII